MIQDNIQTGDTVWFRYSLNPSFPKWIRGVFLRWTNDHKEALVSEWYRSLNDRQYGHCICRSMDQVSEEPPEGYVVSNYHGTWFEAWPIKE